MRRAARAGLGSRGPRVVAVPAERLPEAPASAELPQPAASVLAVSPAGEIALLLGARHPRAAGRLYVHLASRVLATGDARTYLRAKEHMERARDSFVADGDPSAWDDALARMREAHAVARGWFTG